MDIVFLDANVLFSAAYRANSRLRQLCQLPTIQLLTSGYAVEEARRNLAVQDQRDALASLMQPIQIVAGIGSTEQPIFSAIMLPDKDKPILLAAITARATHLLTGDRQHFGSYFGQIIQGVLVIPPAGYLRDLPSEE